MTLLVRFKFRDMNTAPQDGRKEGSRSPQKPKREETKRKRNNGEEHSTIWRKHEITKQTMIYLTEMIK